MFSTAINRLRSTLKLTSSQREVLVGSVLGDGYLYPTVSGKYAYLRLAHSERQKGYLLWKYRWFRDWVLMQPKYQLQNKSNQSKGGYWWFKTVAHPELLAMRQIFYRNREKIVPPVIGEILKSDLSLAIWYLDDGTLAGRSLHLNTQSFSHQDNQLLRATLRRNFGIDSSINKSGGIGKGYILYIGTKFSGKFLLKINRFIPESMHYKTFLTP